MTLNTAKHPVTGVAQRKRARLITLRTPDRNGSPVLFTLRFLYRSNPSMLVTSHPPVYLGVEHICSKTSTSHRRGASAARKAHNLEVTGSTPVAGIISLRSFYRIEPSSWTLNVALHSFTRRCSSAEERLTPSPSFSTPFRGVRFGDGYLLITERS